MILRQFRNEQRDAFTLLETLVALSLLIVAMSFAAQMTVRHNRLLADLKAYRVAVEELTNELDRLVSLTPTEREAAIAALRDAGARVDVAQEPDTHGTRIVVAYEWPEAARSRPKISLTGWAFDRTNDARDATP